MINSSIRSYFKVGLCTYALHSLIIFQISYASILVFKLDFLRFKEIKKIAVQLECYNWLLMIFLSQDMASQCKWILLIFFNHFLPSVCLMA